MNTNTAIEPPKKLLDQVRDKIRFKHYSLRTETCYIAWIKQYILYHGKRHPNAMGAAEVEAFLTYLATVRLVSSSTQNQALFLVPKLCLGMPTLKLCLLNFNAPWLSKWPAFR